ncbi:uncharacterized protein LOC115621093 [Scaptodrosophila lebanonensis]|uniref:Uncharacterized protein LOC115621093 n=1 Tax=Drosophila lebanonensis TaxID=7225 RepID=A0A6J2T6D5_DROLE|nr:uncharacterized protein LOC115621093 [Scaptodrosophila lebanonensis]
MAANKAAEVLPLNESDSKQNIKTKIMPQSVGVCIFCESEAKLVCHRCGDFYCSKKCQTFDWQRHRYICFSMPSLVHPKACSALAGIELPLPPAPALKKLEDNKILACEITNKEVPKIQTQPNVASPAKSPDNSKKNYNRPVNEVVTPTAPVLDHSSNRSPTSENGMNIGNNINASSCESIESSGNNKMGNNKKCVPPMIKMPPSNSTITVTGFRSANRCSVRAANETADKAYFEICEKIDVCGQKMPKLRSVKINSYALIAANEIYHRVKVLAITNKHIARVLFIDHGMTKLRKIDDLRQIPHEILELPCYCLQIQLKDVPNYATSDDILNFLALFERKSFNIVYGMEYDVELFLIGSNISLNQHIRDFCANRELYGQTRPDNDLKNKRNNLLHEAQMYKNFARALDVSLNQRILAKEIKKEELNIVETKALPNPQAINGAINSTTVAIEEPIEIKKSAASILELLEKRNDQISTSIPEAEPKTATETKERQISPEKFSESSNAQMVEDIEKPTSDEKCLPAIKSDITGASTPEKTPVLTPPFEICRLDTNTKDGLKAYIVDNSSILRGIVGAFDLKHARNHANIYIYLKKLNDSEAYEPILNEYVIAKYNGEWFRARVTEIKNTIPKKYTVYYIDFTNVETVTVEDIRRYPTDLTVPCSTNICLIEGFPHKLNDAQAAYLKENLQINKMFNIDGVSYLHDMALLQCNQLIDKLNEL